MKCPYCLKEMELGSFQQDRYTLKWVPLKNDKGIWNFTIFADGIKLLSQENKSKIKVFYCNDCRKFIIDQDNL